MRICILTSSFPSEPDDPTAAAGNFVRDFALTVASRGHAVSVLTQDRRPEASAGGGAISGPDPAFPDIRLHRYPWRGGDRPAGYLRPHRPSDLVAMASLLRRAGRALARLDDEERFQHYLAMWAVPAGWLARQQQRRRRTSYTVWCLGSDIWLYARYPLLRQIVAGVVREADLVYADGLQLAAEAETLSGRRVPFLASCRRLDATTARPARLAGRGPHFLFVGRYARVKGVDVLLEAMARFVAREGRGHLHVFGGGPLEAEIRARAARPDLEDHVSLGTYADAATLASYLAACDAVVIPSRMESIPVVLSDALQQGRPVIVSDVGDMGRLLREVPAGAVVPPEDADALCEAMREVARRPDGDWAPAVSELASRFDLDRTAARWLHDVEALGSRRRA